MLSNYFNYKRRSTKEVEIGRLKMGGNNPIRIQTMANTDTNNIQSSVNQCLRVVEAGCELMRYTTQGIKEVESLREIHSELRKKGVHIPLVADVHFNSNVADFAAEFVEKVRINPGNFIGVRKNKNYTAEGELEEYQLLRKKFIEFLNICKKNNTAVRIGVNHGSLSERIMNKYGDTPEGMVVSCMELLNICCEEDFHNVVISLKASNTVFMVYAVRLLVQEMDKSGFNYPLHLGVTEAGEGEDGRIKSAVGIGALLTDGIGDTIRVSLSEEPEKEIPVAKKLVSYFEERQNHFPIREQVQIPLKTEYEKKNTYTVKNIGGENIPVVITSGELESVNADYYFNGNKIISKEGGIYPLYDKNDIDGVKQDKSELIFWKLGYEDLDKEIFSILSQSQNIVILLYSHHQHTAGEFRAFFHHLEAGGCKTPVILCKQYKEEELEDLQIKASADFGVLFIDGFGDGIFIENENGIKAKDINSLAFGILQASRVRISRTEYISCPGCGRTLFDLPKVISEVKQATSHLKGLKIAIMGCIVNGPGEMADADYGYVGAGRGKVSLYRKKECIEQNIPEEEALYKLIDLIDNHENKNRL